MNLFTKRFGLVLGGVVGVGAIAALAIGASFALFTSTATGGTQTFTAGTVNLYNPITETCTANVSNMEPGDTATCQFQVDYNGSLPTYVGAEASATGALTPELSFTINGNSQGTDPVLIGNSYSDGSGPYTASVAYTLSINADNPYQNTSAVVTVTFYAVQCSNNWAGGSAANEQCAAPGPASWTQIPMSSGNILSSASLIYTASTVAGAGGTGFCQYPSPGSERLTGGGTDSQTIVPGGVSLSITSNGTSYADDGFYVPLGTLGSFSGYTITGTGSGFGSNLWFGNFNWTGGNPNCFISVPPGSNYGLGPSSSGGTLAVTGASSFFMVDASGSCTAGTNTTLANLQGGACGMTSSTPVWVWIGITSPNGGPLSTTITSASAS